MNTPPYLIGGESPLGATKPATRAVVVDWLTVVFPLSAVAPIPDFIRAVRAQFDGTVTEFRSPPGGLHSYAYKALSDVGGVIVAWGGDHCNDTVLLQIPGDGCARIESWRDLRHFVADRRGHITRIDLAYDCIDGAHDLALAVQLYAVGAFNAGGRMPVCSQVGNWLRPDGKGRTLYIGKRGNGKQLCIYEKGKQLGDASSTWVRWELRLSNVHRVVPLEAIEDPAPFFRGAYKALSFVDAKSSRIPTRRAQERISVGKLVDHAREAYGPLLNVLAASGASAVQIVEKIRRDGQPKRLSAPTLDELVARANALVEVALIEEVSCHD